MSGFRVCELGGVLAVSLCCLIILAGAQTTDPSEVTALRAIKSSLVDPLKHLDTWNKGDPCTSNWTGVSCFSMTGHDGYLHIRELQLLNMNLLGSLSPELGQLSHMKILDMMWNKISGSIPKEIGHLISLELLLLNGNQLSGSLPEEIGNLSNLDRLQIDENHISGPLPKSFANLNKTKHFHLNNNSITGQIPPELSRLPNLVHFLLDNNNLSGYLPPEFASLPNLLILQLDNNHFDEGGIPASYSNMSKLLKLSLRNCSLRGVIPDLSRIPHLGYLDLSWNQLCGSIPPNKLSNNMTTIDLSNNNLNGSIPSNFSDLPLLQRLSLENNMLSGSVPSTIWQTVTLVATEKLILDFQNNTLSNIMGGPDPHENVAIRLQGNPLCTNAGQHNITQFCVGEETSGSPTKPTTVCYAQSCPTEYFYEYVPVSPEQCFCVAPIRVGYRLKSPGFSDFIPYMDQFKMYQTSGLGLDLYQLSIDSFAWEEGPRLRMHLKFFPLFKNHTSTFNVSEILRIRDMFTGWTTPNSDIFGPHELLNFTLLGPYSNVILEPSKSEISKGALAGIVLGSILGAVIISSLVSILLMQRCSKYNQEASRKRLLPNTPIKIDGLIGFTFHEMALATNNFSRSNQVGYGGYGKVYKGMLADGTVVAIKRPREGSLQGGKEFFTEIELLSRVHHRNLVSLVGYCEEEGEQMLVYEFMPNGTLRDHLSAKSKDTLSFSMRLHIALGSARGILYLHTEANPPIYHRDIKASNILLDSKFTAKVADFGLSRLAPVPNLDGVLPCHVTTAVKGTPGYLDPEYFLTHKLTNKSDVYSLGVVFLELLTGMPPIAHGKNIIREVNSAYDSGMIFSMIDGRMGSYPSECVERFLRLALRCSKDETDLRPSIAEVVKELEHIRQMKPKTINRKPPQSTAGDSSSVMEMSSSASATENSVSSHISGSVASTIVPC